MFTTDLSIELREAVDALTRPTYLPVTQVVNGTTYTRRVEQPPLLLQLEEAIASTMVGGGGAGRSDPWATSVLDSDALYKFSLIANAVREWCRMAGLRRPTHPADGLRAWHVTTLSDNKDYTWHVSQLREWAGLIRGKLTPRREKTLLVACYECGADTWVDEEGNTAPYPMVFRWVDDALRGTLTCRACTAEWRGEQALNAGSYATRSHEKEEELAEP